MEAYTYKNKIIYVYNFYIYKIKKQSQLQNKDLLSLETVTISSRPPVLPPQPPNNLGT